jgi:hypothetical protein
MQNSIDVIKDIPARKLDDPEKRGTGTSREQKADFQGKHLCEAARENKVIDETASLLVIPCSFCALAAAITSCATLPTEAAAGITTTEAIDPPKHNTHEHEREREREREEQNTKPSPQQKTSTQGRSSDSGWSESVWSILLYNTTWNSGENMYLYATLYFSRASARKIMRTGRSTQTGRIGMPGMFHAVI